MIKSRSRQLAMMDVNTKTSSHWIATGLLLIVISTSCLHTINGLSLAADRGKRQ